MAIRERLLGQTHPLTLSSCYQVAYIADLLDDYQVSCLYLLSSTILTAPLTQLLDKARRAHNGYFNNTLVIERVIERLYDRFPSEYPLFLRFFCLSPSSLPLLTTIKDI